MGLAELHDAAGPATMRLELSAPVAVELSKLSAVISLRATWRSYVRIFLYQMHRGCAAAERLYGIIGLWYHKAYITVWRGLRRKVWLFLFGHYRTFDFTRPSAARALQLAAGDCYFVAAVVCQPLRLSSTVVPQNASPNRIENPM